MPHENDTDLEAARRRDPLGQETRINLEEVAKQAAGFRQGSDMKLAVASPAENAAELERRLIAVRDAFYAADNALTFYLELKGALGARPIEK